MKILVVPDVHLKPQIFDLAEQIPQDKYDNIVVLGDLLDDWGQGENATLYQKTFDRCLEFDKKHPETLWCYGNHDISYLYFFMESGFSFFVWKLAKEEMAKIQKHFGKRLKVIHRIDDTLFSHAGIKTSFCMKAVEASGNNPDDVIKDINSLIKDRSHCNLLWTDNSPIWSRPELYSEDKYISDCFQVAGHTPVKKPLRMEETLFLDTFSTYSSGQPFGDQRLCIVDTLSHECVYADTGELAV